MNERIRQLKESTRPEIDWEARHYTELDNGEKEKWMDEWFEKFAELIVKECANIAYEYDAPKMSGPGMIIAGRIEQHFGVEEASIDAQLRNRSTYFGNNP